MASLGRVNGCVGCLATGIVSLPGHYRLAGNLTVVGANNSAIEINASNIT